MAFTAPLPIMAYATTPRSAMNASTLCEFSTEKPAHPAATRTNGLHAEVEVEDVHAVKPTQTRCQLPHRPGHAILTSIHANDKAIPFQNAVWAWV